MDAARRETNLSPSLDRGQAAMHRQAITFSYDRDCMPSPLRIHRATIRPFSTRLCVFRGSDSTRTGSLDRWIGRMAYAGRPRVPQHGRETKDGSHASAGGAPLRTRAASPLRGPRRELRQPSDTACSLDVHHHLRVKPTRSISRPVPLRKCKIGALLARQLHFGQFAGVNVQLQARMGQQALLKTRRDCPDIARAYRCD